MAKAIFKVFFNIIIMLVNIVLAPINALVEGLFPDFSNLVNSFTEFLNQFFTPALNWFFSILPPNCQTLILLWLIFLVSFITITISVHTIMKVYTIIKNMKIW